MKKIALLTNGIYPLQIGGIQKHSFYLAKHFGFRKIFVDVYTNFIPDELGKVESCFTNEELNYINFINIPFPSVKKFPGHYIYESYLFSKVMYNEVVREKYTVIYAQGFTSWYFLKKNPFQRNIISNLHGLNMFQNSVNFKMKLQMLLLSIPANQIIRKSKLQISLGGQLTNILLSQGANKESIVVFPNGIDDYWLDNLDINNLRNKIKFTFIGRYERLKGIKEFQSVIASTIDVLDYEVEFIGPIPKNKQLQHTRVSYSGLIKNSAIIKEKLIATDILVCPSYSEGMPTVILEAMACGCAIIATDVGANETMVSEDNGWLIKGDIKKNLRKALLEAVALESDALLLKKKHSICKVKENFTWEKVIENFIAEIKK